LINTKRVAWHLRMPEGPAIQPMSSVSTSVGAPSMIDAHLVETVVEQVMKAMKSKNSSVI